MSIIVNLNGKILKKEDALISIFDHGFMFGDSVYEVLITRHGKFFTLREHFNRLLKSGSEISLEIPFTFEGFKEQITKTINNAGNKESYVRIIITRGIGDINIDPSSCFKPNSIIIVNNFKGYTKEYYEKGISLSLVSVRRNLKESINPAIKTGNYLNNILAIIEAKKRGADDGLMLNSDGSISECTTSNFFLVVDGVIKTSSCESGILEGVTRKLVLNLARRENITVDETRVLPKEILDAEEAFVTSTTKGVLAVTRCDDKKIGSGLVGEVTKKMMFLYNKRVEELVSEHL